jgi:lysophospholipase L1-like esterase
MPSRAIQIGINIGVLVVCTVISVVLFEVAIRIFLPVYVPSDRVGFVWFGDAMVGSPGAVFRLSKNAGDYDVEVRFNALGFRDEKSLATSTDRDLFVVGDSIPFGWGVAARDRFSDRLQAILNRPVFNIAIPGLDLDGYDRLLHYAEANGASIKNLIISVSLEHNLRIYDTSHPASSPPALSHPASSAPALPRTNIPRGKLQELKQYLLGHSALYVALTYHVHQTPWLRRIAVRLGLLIPELDVLPDLAGSTEALTTSARRVVQLARGRNAIVLIVPSRRLWVGKTADRAEAARIHEAFIKNLRDSGMIVVDLRDRFEQSGNPLAYHFANDTHWNKEGHRLAAEALAEVLQTSMR